MAQVDVPRRVQEVRGPVRGSAAPPPGRGEQPRAGLQGRGRDAPLYRARGGEPHLGRGRQRVRGLRRLLGPPDRRPRPPGGGAGGAPRGGARHQLRRPHRGRGAPRGPGQGGRPLDRAGALRQLRHRGHHERHPRRPGVHRAGGGDQVRRGLPRARRRPPGAGRLRSPHPGRPGLPWRPGGRRRRDPLPALQRPLRRGRRPGGPAGPGGRRDRGAGGRQHGGGAPRPRLPAGAARPLHPQRGPAHPGRGDDRLPPRLGRGPGALRGHPGPHHPGQDRGGRAPRGGLRGPAGGDGAHRPPGPGLPGGDPLREPPGDGRRAGHPSACAPAGAVRAPGGPLRPPRGRPLPGRPVCGGDRKPAVRPAGRLCRIAATGWGRC